jgi:hypothetical protein
MSNLIIKTALLPQELPEIQTIRRLVFQTEQGVEAELDFDGKTRLLFRLLLILIVSL